MIRLVENMALTHAPGISGSPILQGAQKEIWRALGGPLRELAFIQIYSPGTKNVLYNPYIAEQSLLFLAFRTTDFITEQEMCSCPHAASQNLVLL